MTNLEKYNNVFKECFIVEDESLIETLNNTEFADWDSIGHMNLIAMIEETFEIMLDTDDIMEINSYDKGKDVLSKYDISF